MLELILALLLCSQLAARGDCVWHCLDYVSAADPRVAGIRRGPANDPALLKALEERGLKRFHDFEFRPQNNYDRGLLMLYAESHGVVVAFRSPLHAVVVRRYDEACVVVWDPNVGLRRMTRREFDAQWLGNSLVIYGRRR